MYLLNYSRILRTNFFFSVKILFFLFQVPSTLPPPAPSNPSSCSTANPSDGWRCCQSQSSPGTDSRRCGRMRTGRRVTEGRSVFNASKLMHHFATVASVFSAVKGCKFSGRAEVEKGITAHTFSSLMIVPIFTTPILGTFLRQTRRESFYCILELSVIDYM